MLRAWRLRGPVPEPDGSGSLPRFALCLPRRRAEQGMTVAGACISKTLSKASVAPIAEGTWGYMGALWYVGWWQVVSLCAGMVYVR